MVFVHNEVTGRTSVLTTCPICSNEYELDVPTKGFIKWLCGEELIQCALPELSAEDHERLISGMCPDCLDKLYGDDDI